MPELAGQYGYDPVGPPQPCNPLTPQGLRYAVVVRLAGPYTFAPPSITRRIVRRREAQADLLVAPVTAPLARHHVLGRHLHAICSGRTYVTVTLASTVISVRSGPPKCWRTRQPLPGRAKHRKVRARFLLLDRP